VFDGRRQFARTGSHGCGGRSENPFVKAGMFRIGARFFYVPGMQNTETFSEKQYAVCVKIISIIIPGKRSADAGKMKSGIADGCNIAINKTAAVRCVSEFHAAEYGKAGIKSRTSFLNAGYFFGFAAICEICENQGFE